MDLTQLDQLLGLAGAPFVKAIVKDLNLNKAWHKVLASQVVAIALNFALMLVYNTDWKVALGTGIVTGMFANAYNDLTESSK